MHVERTVFSAITVQRGITRAIVHNDNHSRVRQRSNLMHELGHAFLGHRCAPLLTGEGDRHFDQKIEAEAQYLAGCLLITNEGAYEIALSGMTNAAACKMSVLAQKCFNIDCVSVGR